MVSERVVRLASVVARNAEVAFVHPTWATVGAVRQALATFGPSTVRVPPTPTVVGAPVAFTATLPPFLRHIGPLEATAPGIVTVSIVKQVLASSWRKRLHSCTVDPAAMPSTWAVLERVLVTGAPPVGFGIDPFPYSVQTLVVVL